MEKIIYNLFEKEEYLLKKYSWNKNIFLRNIEKNNFKISWFFWLRRVWKTTFLISERLKNEKTIYITLDDLSLKEVDFFNLISELQKNFWIKKFFLDEIQNLKDWENILKNIYDFLDIEIIFSWSSMIDLVSWSVDLSRRVISEKINIFSFQEYLKFYWKNFEWIKFFDLFEKNFEISKKFSSEISLIQFKKYLEFWQFWYWFENENKIVFRKLLENSIKKSIREDLTKFIDIHTTRISKIEDLLFFISSSLTSELTINSLSKKVWLNNVTVEKYVEYLEKLWWIFTIKKYWSVTDSIRKERKIYLTNTNVLSVFSSFLLSEENLKWNLRENFVLISLMRIKDRYWFEIFFKWKTDFIIKFKDGKIFELEVWWKSKSRNDVFTVKDDILIWNWKNIPLYLFGFLV